MCGICGEIILLYWIWSLFLAFYFEIWIAYFLFMGLHVLIIFFNASRTFIVSLPVFFYTLRPSCVPFFSILLHSLSVSFSRNMLERSYFKAWSIYFGGDEKHVLAYSQCRNSYLFVACMWVLILGAWNISQQGSQKLDQTQHKVRGICGRFCLVWSYMALVGIWMSFKEHAILSFDL